MRKSTLTALALVAASPIYVSAQACLARPLEAERVFLGASAKTLRQGDSYGGDLLVRPFGRFVIGGGYASVDRGPSDGRLSEPRAVAAISWSLTQQISACGHVGARHHSGVVSIGSRSGIPDSADVETTALTGGVAFGHASTGGLREWGAFAGVSFTRQRSEFAWQRIPLAPAEGRTGNAAFEVSAYIKGGPLVVGGSAGAPLSRATDDRPLVFSVGVGVALGSGG